MYNSFKQSLSTWNQSTTDRQKQQHTFIAIAIILLVIAGVLGLLNQGLGQQLLAISIAAAAIFIVNAVVWALLQSFVLFRLQTDPTVKEDVVAAIKPATARTRKTSKK